MTGMTSGSRTILFELGSRVDHLGTGAIPEDGDEVS